MPMLWINFVLIVSALGISLTNPAPVYSQNVEELRAEFEKKLHDLRAEFEKKLQDAFAQEIAKSRAKESQPAQQNLTELAAPSIPSTANKTPMGVFFNVELAGNNFWGVETDFAARNAPGNIFPQIGQVGRFRTVDVHREFTVRPTLGYYLPNESGIISANFHHTKASGNGSFRAPGAVIPSLLPPSLLGELGFFPDSARANNQVQINQFDGQYQYPIQVTKTFALNPEIGIRGLWFKNNVKSIYLFDQPNAGFNFRVDQRNDSWAIGPDIGIAGTFELSKNLSLTARGKGGYLLGQSKAKQVFCRGAAFSSPGCGGPFNFSQTEWQGYPFTEGEFSLNYALPAETKLAGLSASLGYRVGAFFNLVNRIKDVGDEESSAHIIFDRLNLTYDSIFFKLQYLW